MYAQIVTVTVYIPVWGKLYCRSQLCGKPKKSKRVYGDGFEAVTWQSYLTCKFNPKKEHIQLAIQYVATAVIWYV